NYKNITRQLYSGAVYTGSTRVSRAGLPRYRHLLRRRPHHSRGGLLLHKVAQRTHDLALGYEDLNHHGLLRASSVLTLLLGKRDLVGRDHKRTRDSGYPAGGVEHSQPTRVDQPEAVASDRYKRITIFAD